MKIADYQCIIDELEVVISDTKTLMVRFEATDFDETMSDDYLALHKLYTRMVEEQRRYTQEMLVAEE
ncbi:hypothetical protein SAMN05661010_02262 [Modicisalibacter muralis]|uniref:Uncharacterized protein n=1 Tax=Modicisalibacter muralis TaxID=119000 RepID=A0A1G9M2P7_9GAMM|nr:hypothetical protein [Halomonas muralis]SDL68207.1 hypothetical protein SAMN05661010_02262 [Halomonas muralis]